jgi:hypothetical protein
MYVYTEETSCGEVWSYISNIREQEMKENLVSYTDAEQVCLAIIC